MKYALCFGIVFLCTKLSAQQITVNASQALTIDGSRPVNELTILLQPQNGFELAGAQVTSANPKFVHLNHVSDDSYKTAFTARMDSIWLKLSVNAAGLQFPGTYEVTYVIESSKKAATLVTITLTKTPAVLDTIKTVRAEYVQGHVINDPLMIREKSQHNNIAGISAIQEVTPDQYNLNYFIIGNSTLPVPAGKIATKTIKLDKAKAASLPLGITKGKFIISAPEAASQLEVPFIIVKRIWRFWIAVLLLAGSLVGFLIRIVLKGATEWQRQLVIRAELLKKITRESAGIEDKIFVDKIKDITIALQVQHSIKWHEKTFTTEPLVTEIREATDGYNAALTDLKSRLKTEKDRASQLSPIVNNASTFDAAVVVELKNILPHYFEAEDLINRSDAGRARQRLDDFERALKTFIKLFHTQFTSRLSGILQLFPATQTPPLVQQQLTAAATPLQADVTSLSSPASDAATLSTQVLTANQVQTRWRSIIQSGATAMAASYQLVFIKDGTPVMVTFKNTFNAWNTYLQLIVDNINQLLLPQPGNNLDTAWTAAADQRRAAGAFLGPAASTTTIAFTLQNNQTQVFVPGTRLDGAVIADPIDQALQKAKQQFWITAIIQTGLLLLIMIAVAYTFYQPNFIGTWSECIGIFLFAFGLDITIDNIGKFKPE